jgi:hypothetical protein
MLHEMTSAKMRQSKLHSVRAAGDRNEPRGRQGATLLTRGRAAALLGVSPSTVRRLEGRALRPIVRADGVHVFNAEEVQAVAKSRAASGASLSAGEVAARACELFRHGKGAVDVVIALRQPFEVVLELRRAYVAEEACLFVPESIAARIRESFFVEHEPFTPEGLCQLLDRLTNRNLDLSRRLRGAGERRVLREDSTATGLEPAASRDNEALQADGARLAGS